MIKSASITICLTLCIATMASAASIVSPASGTTLAPGASVAVRVAPSSGEQIAAAAVIISGGSPADAAQSSTVPGAFEAQITVPGALVGPALIISYATSASGTPSMDFVEVLIDPGPVTSLAVSSAPSLGFVGAIHQLHVKALFADGITRDVTQPEQGSTYSSSNDTVLGVSPNGQIQARTNGTAVVSISNRGQTVAQTIQVTVPDPPTNHIPIANPGADQTVAPESLVTLSGTGSTDPDSDPLTYQWKQESGRLVILRTPDATQTVFTAPRVNGVEVLTFSLVVSDNKGATTFPAIVKVTVDPAAAASAPAPNSK